MKMMPYGVAAALLLGGSLMAPPAKAWQSESDGQLSSARPVDSQMTGGPSIRAVQQELKAAGIYKGAIDGVWGPDSRSAIERYQAQHGLYASGQLDHDTLQAMGGGDSVTQSGSSGGDSALAVGIGAGTSGASRDFNAPKGDDDGSSMLGSSDEEQR